MSSFVKCWCPSGTGRTCEWMCVHGEARAAVADGADALIDVREADQCQVWQRSRVDRLNELPATELDPVGRPIERKEKESIKQGHT